jgi:hypothetical protein
MDLTDWTESTHRGAYLTSRGPAPRSCQTACQHSHAGNELRNPALSPWENAYRPCCAPTLWEHVCGWVLVPLAAVVVGWAWVRTWVRS